MGKAVIVNGSMDEERERIMREDKILLDIRDVVNGYFEVLEDIHGSYQTVIKELKESKELIAENERLREENEQLRLKLRLECRIEFDEIIGDVEDYDRE